MQLTKRGKAMLAGLLTSAGESMMDADQRDAHRWLAAIAHDRRIFIGRFMKRGDMADPGRLPSLCEEVEKLRLRFEDRIAREKAISKLVNRAVYHLKLMPPSGEAARHDCDRVIEAVIGLQDLGVSRRDHRIRKMQGLVRPGAFPSDMRLPEILVQLVNNPSPGEDPDEPGPEDSHDGAEYSDVVLRVRERLRGATVVMTGGDLRPQSRQRIIDAFELADLEWVVLSEHASAGPLVPAISRPEVDLVLVLVRWSGHQQVDSARRLAREAGKPLVMLPRGYGLEQIATGFEAQVSDQRLVVDGLPQV